MTINSKNILIAIIFLLLYKIVMNSYYLITLNYYYRKYKTYIKDSDSWFIREHKQKIVNLFKRAGTEDAHQPQTEPAGYGMLRTASFSVFQNLTVQREDIVIIVNGDFREAMGVYKQRILETLNPFYWIELFISLPTTFFEYLGFKTDNILVKILQLIWQIITFISVVVGIVFNQEFMIWLQNAGK